MEPTRQGGCFASSELRHRRIRVNFIEAAVMPESGPQYSERLCGQRGLCRFLGRGRRSVDVVLRQLELLASTPPLALISSIAIR